MVPGVSTKNTSSVTGKTDLMSSSADRYERENCSKLVERRQRMHDRQNVS